MSHLFPKLPLNFNIDHFLFTSISLAYDPSFFNKILDISLRTGKSTGSRADAFLIFFKIVPWYHFNRFSPCIDILNTE